MAPRYVQEGSFGYGTEKHLGQQAVGTTKTGWFLRVCKTKTEACSIHLEVGMGGGNSGSHRNWTTWHSSDESEIDFPSELRNVAEVWIKGTPYPKGRNVHMCVCYQDHVTQKIELDNSEEQETRQGDQDDCVC